MPKTIALADAAHRLRISWHLAYRYVLTGRLDARKVGGRWLVTEVSVGKVGDELRAERDS